MQHGQEMIGGGVAMMASRRVARTEWSEREARVGCGGGERRSGGVEKKKKLKRSGEGMEYNFIGGYRSRYIRPISRRRNGEGERKRGRGREGRK